MVPSSDISSPFCRQRDPQTQWKRLWQIPRTQKYLVKLAPWYSSDHCRDNLAEGTALNYWQIKSYPSLVLYERVVGKLLIVCDMRIHLQQKSTIGKSLVCWKSTHYICGAAKEPNTTFCSWTLLVTITLTDLAIRKFCGQGSGSVIGKSFVRGNAC